MIVGAEAGLAVIGERVRGPGARRVAWPEGAPASARLAATVETCCERGQPVVQANAPAGRAQLAVPLVREGRTVGAFGVALRGAAPGQCKAVTDLLGFGARSLALWLEAEERRDRLAARLRLAGGLLDHERLAEAAHSLASDLARSAGCERVSIGLLRDGRMHVIALSTSLRFKEESDGIRDLCAAMEEAVDQDARIDLPQPAADPARSVHAHARLCHGSAATAVCTVPLADHGQTAGALTGEWVADVAGAQARTRIEEAALLCGPILALMSRAEAGPHTRARAWLAKRVERHLGADRALARGALAAAAALILLVAIFPASYRIAARATLEGRVQRALVAGVAGYLSEANARAGDLVHAGDELARIDDRDLRLERRQRASEQAQLERQYREALAGHDRSQVRILRAQIEQAAAKLDLVEEQLTRTSVVAPFDGVVLEGDLSQALGSPVELGDVLFELAPLDGYRIVLEVDGRDIADVAPGQRGRLALSALPGRSLPLAVERITPLSTTRDGRSYFRVEAALDEPLEALRPGMEGLAKVEVGRRRLLWIWTHGLVDWLRLRLWSWTP